MSVSPENPTGNQVILPLNSQKPAMHNPSPSNHTPQKGHKRKELEVDAASLQDQEPASETTKDITL